MRHITYILLFIGLAAGSAFFYYFSFDPVEKTPSALKEQPSPSKPETPLNPSIPTNPQPVTPVKSLTDNNPLPTLVFPEVKSIAAQTTPQHPGQIIIHLNTNAHYPVQATADNHSKAKSNLLPEKTIVTKFQPVPPASQGPQRVRQTAKTPPAEQPAIISTIEKTVPQQQPLAISTTVSSSFHPIYQLDPELSNALTVSLSAPLSWQSLKINVNQSLIHQPKLPAMELGNLNVSIRHPGGKIAPMGVTIAPSLAISLPTAVQDKTQTTKPEPFYAKVTLTSQVSKQVNRLSISSSSSISYHFYKFTLNRGGRANPRYLLSQTLSLATSLLANLDIFSQIGWINQTSYLGKIKYYYDLSAGLSLQLSPKLNLTTSFSTFDHRLTADGQANYQLFKPYESIMAFSLSYRI